MILGEEISLSIAVVAHTACILQNVSSLTKVKTKYSLLEENNFKKGIHFIYICL